jgi:hypothetical protein
MSVVEEEKGKWKWFNYVDYNTFPKECSATVETAICE